MSDGWTKLFNEIVASSIWSEDDKTRIVWITLLAMSDAGGHVKAALPGLADLSRVSLDACAKAVKILESPDKYSRDKDHEGRRIAPEPGGWHILNYEKFRNRTGRSVSADPRRAYQREWMRQKRAREEGVNAAPEPVNELSTPVNPSASASVDTIGRSISRPPRPHRNTELQAQAEGYEALGTVLRSPTPAALPGYTQPPPANPA